jgi:purine-nucleoside phosphorylase
MNPIYEKLVKCADAVKSKIKFQPQVALILGSGLGDYAETMQVEETMNTLRLKDFRFLLWPGIREDFYLVM